LSSPEQPVLAPALSRGRHWRKLLLWVIGLGCLARIITYALDLQIYHDDAYLMNNVLVRSWPELLGPLGNNQVAPPGFLWISKGVLSLSRTDRAARLLPFLCGLTAIFLCYRLARNVLDSTGALLATAVFAASHATIVYSTRAKPYEVDVLISAAILVGVTGWLRHPGRRWPVICLALLGPAAFWLSYPSTFVLAGGAIVMFAYGVTHRRRLSRGFWGAWSLLALCGLAGGALLYRFHLSRCLGAESTQYLQAFWARAFPPPWHEPLALSTWLVTTHTGRMYAYPFGEKNFGSVIPFVLCVMGMVRLHRRGKDWLLAALLAPQAVLFAAAALRLYPYGGHPRVSLFLAPSLCVLIGAGILQVARALRPRGRAAFLSIVTVILLAMPLVEMGSAGFLRIREQREGSIKRGLTQLLEERRPGDLFRRAAAPAALEGGGEFRQVCEYYAALLPWPAPLTAPLPATAAAGARLFLLHFDESAAGSQDARRLRHTLSSERVLTLPGFRGQLRICEYRPTVSSGPSTTASPAVAAP
jgi:hypothetical protein